jgi:hypothetical protein
VHHVRGAHDASAEDLADSLMTETHPEDGDAGLTERADGVDRDADVAGLVRAARTG